MGLRCFTIFIALVFSLQSVICASTEYGILSIDTYHKFASPSELVQFDVTINTASISRCDYIL